MSANVLGCRMNHYICAMLQWTDQDRCKCVINNENNAMTMSHFCHCLKVGDIRIRIAERLSIHNLCIWLDSSFKGCEVIDFDNGVGDALCSKGMGDEVE